MTGNANPGGGAPVARRGTARSAAARRAMAAKSGWDAERARHDQQVAAALTDYYAATSRAERIRTAARRKAATITAAAERQAAPPVADARAAVRRLRDLLGGNAEVAELCGLSAAAVRDILAATRENPEGSGRDDQ